MAQLQHESIDRLALQEAVAAALGEKALGAPDAEQAPREQLQTVTQHLQVAAPRWLKGPDASKMPALVHAQDANQGHGQWGVLRAGDEMMQISPTEGGMVFEVKINPVDIGQLQLGLPVAIKLDAFDYSVFGNLEGTLVYLSSDTLVEQAANGQSNSYYRAHVILDAEKARSHPNPMLAAVVLKPGMTATVDIRTGQRSVLKYLAKPIFKAFGGAMNER